MAEKPDNSKAMAQKKPAAQDADTEYDIPASRNLSPDYIDSILPEHLRGKTAE
jgi:hypothetical protein